MVTCLQYHNDHLSTMDTTIMPSNSKGCELTLRWRKANAAGPNANPGDRGDVVLKADTGASITKEDGWVYTDGAEITDVTPDEGQQGTVVVISGSDLLANGTEIEKVTILHCAEGQYGLRSHTGTAWTYFNGGFLL